MALGRLPGPGARLRRAGEDVDAGPGPETQGGSHVRIHSGELWLMIINGISRTYCNMLYIYIYTYIYIVDVSCSHVPSHVPFHF